MDTKDMSTSTVTPAATNVAAAAPAAAAPASKGKGRGKGKGKGKGKKSNVPARLKVSPNQGIYILPSRVENWLNAAGINRAQHDAIEELRDAEPHVDPTKKDGSRTALRELKSLSDATQKTVADSLRAVAARDAAARKKEEAAKERQKGDIDAKRVTQATLDAEEKKRKEDKEKKIAEDKRKRAEEAKKAEEQRIARGLPPSTKRPAPPKKTSGTPYADEIDAVSSTKYRFSADVELVPAAAGCIMVHELIECGVNRVMKDKKRILQTHHLVTDEASNLPTSALFKVRGPWTSAQKLVEKRAADIANGVKREKKTEKKAADKKEEDTAASAEDESTSRSFHHYVKNVFHNVINARVAKATENRQEYERLKLSQPVTTLLSDMLIDYLDMLTELIDGELSRNKNKTVTDSVMRGMIQFVLKVGNAPHEAIFKQIDDKIKEYNKYCATQSLLKEEKLIQKIKEEKEKAAAAAAAPAPAAAAEEKKQ